MDITILGEPRFISPVRRTVKENLLLPEEIVKDSKTPASPELFFELAGPRARLFFDPEQTRAGIVTCGGLCPGLNNVIRSIYLELHYAYGVKHVIGFRGGYQGLDPNRGREPLELTAEIVDSIHKEGGTLLGTSRGRWTLRWLLITSSGSGLTFYLPSEVTEHKGEGTNCIRKRKNEGMHFR